MDFAELSHKVIALYLEGSYRAALEVVVAGREDFPNQDSTLTWYEACLLSVSGHPERALQVLTDGLDRGLGWHPEMLRDSDLDSARSLDGWEAFVTRSAARVDTWDVKHPQPFIRAVPNPIGTVIALHGGGSDPERFFELWVSATPPRWSVVIPVGEVPTSQSEWAWPFDLETDSLIAALNLLSLTEPVVLAGFSQGSRLAAKAAWDGDLNTAGLILTAAALTPQIWSDSRKCTVPTFVVVGTEDAYENCMATAEVLRQAHVPVALDVREGLGHELVDDLDQVMKTGLDWILSLIHGRAP